MTMQPLKENSDRGGAIPCPKCGARTRCTDSRPCEQGIRRRRMCRKCSERFTTLEVIVGVDGRSDMPDLFVERVTQRMRENVRDIGETLADLEAISRMHARLLRRD